MVTSSGFPCNLFLHLASRRLYRLGSSRDAGRWSSRTRIISRESAGRGRARGGSRGEGPADALRQGIADRRAAGRGLRVPREPGALAAADAPLGAGRGDRGGQIDPAGEPGRPADEARARAAPVGGRAHRVRAAPAVRRPAGLAGRSPPGITATGSSTTAGAGRCCGTRSSTTPRWDGSAAGSAAGSSGGS